MRWNRELDAATSLIELADLALPGLKAELRGVAAVIDVGSVHAPTVVVGDLERLEPGFYFAHIARDDPMQRYGQACQERVFRGFRHVPRAELLASRAHADYYAPRRLGDVIATGFVDGDFLSSEMTSFACFRADSDRPYDEDDVKLVEERLPILGAAIARFRPPPVLAADTDLVLSSVVGFLGDRSLLVFDALGHLLWVSPRASEPLGDGFVPPRALVQAVRRAAQQKGEPVHVLATRVADHHVTLHLVTRGARSILIAELVAGERLSKAETRVFRAVGQGLSNAEIAAQLHVSVATVKTHLQHIFAKLDVSSRLELAVLARGR